MTFTGSEDIVMGLPPQENKLLVTVEYRSVLISESYQSIGFTCNQQSDIVKCENIIKNKKKNARSNKSSALF
jgi:hypothetical protein